MPKRRHICDVPGCERERNRWQRICEACFKALPRDIRYAITDNWRCGNRGEHRRACKRAEDYFTENPPLPPGEGRGEGQGTSPAQAYQNAQRLLGERS